VIGEEGAQLGGAVGGEHAGDDLGAVVEAAVAYHVPQRAGGAGLRVPGAVDQAGDPFVVRIVADDGIDSCPIFCGTVIPTLLTLPMTGLGASSESGLSGDFEATVPGSWLNEDPPGQEDEIRAFVELWDRDTNIRTATFMSNQLSGNWP